MATIRSLTRDVDFLLWAVIIRTNSKLYILPRAILDDDQQKWVIFFPPSAKVRRKGK